MPSRATPPPATRCATKPMPRSAPTSLPWPMLAGLMRARPMPSLRACASPHVKRGGPGCPGGGARLGGGPEESRGSGGGGEVREAKGAGFEFACAHLREDAIVASTTSTMLSTELSGLVPRPERFLNCHWLNPAYLIPLVELSPHAGTAREVTERMKRVLEAIGKKPVVCAAAPGFIVPRLQALVMNEAARMVEQGIATAEDVDRAVRYGFGIRYASMGVVEFIDYGGLDILYYASHYMAQALGEPRFEPPAIVDRYMHQGRRGLRDGRGFFDWRGGDAAAYRKDVLARQLALLRHLGLAPEPGAALRAGAGAPRSGA